MQYTLTCDISLLSLLLPVPNCIPQLIDFEMKQLYFSLTKMSHVRDNKSSIQESSC